MAYLTKLLDMAVYMALDMALNIDSASPLPVIYASQPSS